MNPKDFKLEQTTLWTFPERGNWATHNSKYRGNFAPQVARNIIETYSKVNDYIVDPMVGSGTTLIEAKLLNRNALGIDINPKAVELAKEALNFDFQNTTKQIAELGNAKNLDKLKNDSIDLVLTHPPYLDIIKYSGREIEEDLSNIGSIKKFCFEIEKVAKEIFRILKPNCYSAILIGDTRKAQHYIPLSYYILQCFLKAGFALKEEIIKAQHNCTSSKRWASQASKYNFYLIMHEHLFVFRKPKPNENLSKIKWSLTQENA